MNFCIINQMEGRGRNWIFTCFAHYLEGHRINDQINYIIEGKEVCPETKREHLQGYIELKKQQRLSWLKNNVCETAYFAPRRGTQAEAIAYAKKDGDFKEIGEPWISQQGRRTDVTRFKRNIMEGHSDRQLAEEDGHSSLFLRHWKMVHVLRTIMAPTKYQKKEVIVIVGPTGVGKTRWCHETYPDIYVLPPVTAQGLQWYCGYSGEKEVLYDDFNGVVPITHMLRTLDGYKLTVPIKGGHTAWVPRVVCITSNNHPNNWYPNATTAHMAALNRRITRLVELGTESVIED